METPVELTHTSNDILMDSWMCTTCNGGFHIPPRSISFVRKDDNRRQRLAKTRLPNTRGHDVTRLDTNVGLVLS